jgi:hypothetical protein
VNVPLLPLIVPAELVPSSHLMVAVDARGGVGGVAVSEADMVVLAAIAVPSVPLASTMLPASVPPAAVVPKTLIGAAVARSGRSRQAECSASRSGCRRSRNPRNDIRPIQNSWHLIGALPASLNRAPGSGQAKKPAAAPGFCPSYRWQAASGGRLKPDLNSDFADIT